MEEHTDEPQSTRKTGGRLPLAENKKQLDITTTVHNASPTAALLGSPRLAVMAHASLTCSGKPDAIPSSPTRRSSDLNGVACTDGSTTGGTALNTIAPDGTTSIAHPSTSQTNLDAGTYN